MRSEREAENSHPSIADINTYTSLQHLQGVYVYLNTETTFRIR
jgi:hypothetical protein